MGDSTQGRSAKQSNKYCGIYRGRGGFSGVVDCWERAERLTKGVSGVRFKAFKTHEEARAFVSRAGAGEENEAGKKFYGIYRGRGGFSGVVDRWWGAGGAEGLTKGVSGVRLKAFKTPEEAEAFAGGAGAGEKSEAGAAAAERGLAGRGPAAVKRQQAGGQPAEEEQGGAEAVARADPDRQGGK